jgi:phosphoribosylanthranilate isomerase
MRIKICGLSREQDIDYVNEAQPDYAGFVFAESKRQVSGTLAQYLRFRLADGITPVGVFVNAPINDIAALFHNGTISVVQLHGAEDESYIARLKRKCMLNGKPSQIKVIKAIKSSEIFNTSPAVQKSGKSKQKKSKSPNTDSSLLLNSLSTNPAAERTGYSCLGKVFVSGYIPFVLPQKGGVCTLRIQSNVVDYFLIDSGSGSGKLFDWKLLDSLKINKPWFLAGGVNIDNIEKAIALNPFAIDVSSGAETDGIKDREKILQLTAAARKGK